MTKSFCLKAMCVALLSIDAIAQNVSTPPTTPEAQVRLGNDYLAQKDYSSAMVWFRKAAERSNPVAENNIGWLYENGFGVKQDYTEALSWLRKAASGGYAEAQNNIGWLYQNGWGVKQDYVEAMSWYRKAAEQGNVRASANIAFLYNDGLGVKQDYSEAATWYQVAAQHGNSKAQVYLGRLYQNGLGVAQWLPCLALRRMYSHRPGRIVGQPETVNSFSSWTRNRGHETFTIPRNPHHQ